MNAIEIKGLKKSFGDFEIVGESEGQGEFF